jgi:WD40 repeat protein
MQIERDPNGALVFSTTSLEMADTREGRILVMRTLWKAPPVRVLEGAGLSGRVPKFSPDGSRLAASGNAEEVLIFHQDGGAPLRLGGHPATPHSPSGAAWATTGLVVTSHGQTVAHIWEVPTGQLLRTIRFSQPTWCQVGEGYLFGEAEQSSREGSPYRRDFLRWKLPYGMVEKIGSVDLAALGVTSSRFDEQGEKWLYSRGGEILYRLLPAREKVADVVVGHHDNAAFLWLRQPREPMWIPQSREPGQVWSQDAVTGERRCWSLTELNTEPLDVIPPPPQPSSNRSAIRCGDGKWRVFQQGRGAESPQLWDVNGLEGNEPLPLLKHADWYESFMDIHPSGKWLVASAGAWDQLVFWPLRPSYPSIVKGHSDMYGPVAFSPDGAWLVTNWADGGMRLWPVPGTGGRLRVLKSLDPSESRRMFFDAQGKQMITVGFGTELGVVSLEGDAFRRLDGLSRNHLTSSGAFSPSGRFAAAGTNFGSIEKKVLRIWDLETDQARVFDLEHDRPEVPDDLRQEGSKTGYQNGIHDLAFIDDSTLLTAGAGGVRKWDLRRGSIEMIIEEPQATMTSMALSSDRTKMLTLTWHNDNPRARQAIVFHNLVTHESRILDEFGASISSFVIDPTGRVALTGGSDGIVHVGSIDGGDPHVLVGHDGPVKGVAISPDLRWAASVGQDKTLRLWPIPDLSKPPLHTLPHDELIAKLKSLTNLRAVRDPESSTGWKIEVGPFPGWAEVPEW